MIINKDDIERFLNNPEGYKEQAPKLDQRPQLIPLRSRDQNGEILSDAIPLYKSLRKSIFEQKQSKEFSILNQKGEQYKIKLRYIDSPSWFLRYIINENLYLPLVHQERLIESIKTNPHQYQTTIVQKVDKSGASWLMLHIQLQETK